MIGKMAVAGKGEPIEAAIAEACALYLAHFGAAANLVKINPDNPASVDAPEGVRLERSRNILPGAAWAGRDEA